jgi:hypothetical protein
VTQKSQAGFLPPGFFYFSDRAAASQELEQKYDHGDDQNDVNQSAADVHQETNQPQSH